MIAYSSNIGQLARETRPGVVRLDAPASAGGGAVGDRLARTLAARIHERGLRGVGSGGERWPRNAPSTIERKGFDQANVVTGQMLDERHIAGEVTSSANETTIRCGTGETDADGTSDRDRAYYAETGQSARRIVRSFFGVSREDADALTAIVGDEWDRRASASGAGPGGAGGGGAPTGHRRGFDRGGVMP